MTNFKETYTQNFSKSLSYLNADVKYWKNFEFPISVKEFSYIDYIDVSPVEPYYIAVTTGPKIDIYHQQTAQVWCSITRFKKLAYGARFRKDGQLLIAGSEEGQVKLFNYRHKQVLRAFEGHKGPVHRTDFIHNSSDNVVSFSDDKTVALWNISDEKLVRNFTGHTDFIRGGVSSPASEHIIISGAMDHTVKIWDSRTGECVNTFDHKSPVQDVICYPSGSVIASAGGTTVKIWDLTGNRLLSVISQHHKPITSLTLASNNTRLLSASLDRHVKVYDLNTYNTIHSMDYPSPIFALGVAPKDSTIVTGMLYQNGSGLVSFQQKSSGEKENLNSDDSTKRKKSRSRRFKIKPGDEIITEEDKEKLARYDRLLCKFQYTKALDTALQSGFARNKPHIGVAVVRELIRRKGLVGAVSGRKNTKSLLPIFRFLLRNIRNKNFTHILTHLANVVIDLYADKALEDPKLLTQLTLLQSELELDLKVSKMSSELVGVIEMILNVSHSRK